MASGTVMAPAKSLAEMQRVVQNDYVNATLTVVLMALVVALVGLGLRAALRARRTPGISTQETPYVAA
jgi:carbon starvation protein